MSLCEVYLDVFSAGEPNEIRRLCLRFPDDECHYAFFKKGLSREEVYSRVMELAASVREA